MNLDYVCNEIARLHVEIRHQENEIEMLKRAGISTASAGVAAGPDASQAGRSL
jgi:hypothetical protein